MTAKKVTKSEQSDLLGFVKRRVKVVKADAARRNARLVENFETQLAGKIETVEVGGCQMAVYASLEKLTEPQAA